MVGSVDDLLRQLRIVAIIAQKKYTKRLERERLEAERLAKLEAERLEKERLAKLEAERLGKERPERERLEAERLEREGLAKLEAERLEAEQLERERLAKLEAERFERERYPVFIANKLIICHSQSIPISFIAVYCTHQIPPPTVILPSKS